MGPPMWGLCPLLIVSFACFIFLMPAKKYLCFQMDVLPASTSLHQNFSVQRGQKELVIEPSSSAGASSR